MKKCIVLLLALAVMAGLSACAATSKNAEDATKETAEAATTQATVAPTEIPTAQTAEEPTDATAEMASEMTMEETVAPTEGPAGGPAEEPTAEPTEQPHSVFYVSGYSVDQIIAYFNEVALGMENAAADGNAALVQKWDRPIYYRIEGMPNRKDAQTLDGLAKQLNAVEGFPGIQAATALEQNLTIYFLKDAEFKTQFGHILEGETADGVVQLWHNDSNGTYTGRIGYRQEADQEIRDAIIPEKLVNLLGISRVTMEKEISEDTDEAPVVKLSDLDWSVIKLLYNPRIHNGMNADECEMIIRELYY